MNRKGAPDSPSDIQPQASEVRHGRKSTESGTNPACGRKVD